ncbi:MAG TPA: glycoside hydrolase family 27 protein [Clostridiales bacterium]|nr:glycoside hydrolase family 27 protein [Clostridiales bacterium]
MNKNSYALTPPMGWNSYDYYDTTVTEDRVKANADVMAARLKQYGWEYVVVDIQWYAYDTGSKRDKYQYIPFGKVEIDEYSRLLPCPDRFPSAAGGQGFRPLADYVHSLGLKFGIHMMRGIPRIAAHNHMKIKGTTATAGEIADPYSICRWNPDMYGLDVKADGAQQYYDSLFELYARWGVDFVKVDDICRHDMPSAKIETEMIHKAIKRCGRPMVLSLSPGPALVDQAWHYKKHANMWRITDDFWDNWPLLKNMFERCEMWQDHVAPGCWPDCDMLPLGYIGKGFGQERYTNFSRDEQITMMTLWCMFRSPMMLGAELTRLDEWTESLITNSRVLRLLSHSCGARQIMRDDQQAVWISDDTDGRNIYVAVFNLSEEGRSITVRTEELELADIDSFMGYRVEELWSGDTAVCRDADLEAVVPSHGAKLFRIDLTA